MIRNRRLQPSMLSRKGITDEEKSHCTEFGIRNSQLRSMKSSIKVRSLILVISTFSLIAASPSKPIVSREITGVLYYMEGGTGSGEICFRAKNRLLCVDYENPRKEYGPEDTRRYNYGSIWRVRYHLERFSQEDAKVVGQSQHLVLDSLTFTGHFDSAVISANEFVIRHYTLLANGNYEYAYRDLSTSLRERQSYASFVDGFRTIKFKTRLPEHVGPNTFMRFAVPAYATAIVSHTKNRIVIDVDMSHFVERNQEKYRFDLARADNSWEIQRVRGISDQQFARPQLKLLEFALIMRCV